MAQSILIRKDDGSFELLRGDGEGKALLKSDTIEELTGAGKIIDTDHAYIHEGIAFKSFLEVGDLTGTTSTYYTIKTSDLYLHFKNLHLSALGGTCKATIRKGTTENPIVFTETGGEPNDGSNPDHLTGPHNMNDVSENTTGVVIKVDPTFDNEQDGEPWHIIQVVGDSTNQFTSTAETQGVPTEELVFNTNTYYIIEVENVSDDPDNVLLTLFWYEEDEGAY